MGGNVRYRTMVNAFNCYYFALKQTLKLADPLLQGGSD